MKYFQSYKQVFELITSILFPSHNKMESSLQPQSQVSLGQSLSHLKEPEPESVKEEEIKEKEEVKNDRGTVDLWLTEQQMIILQSKLPVLYSLHRVRSPSSSRLVKGSKTLENQSLIFVNRKRGRPQGSTQKFKVNPSVERKSSRISNKKKKKNNQQKKRREKRESSESQSQREHSYFNQQEYEQSVSFGRSVSLQRSGSKVQLRSESKGMEKQNDKDAENIRNRDNIVEKCRSMLEIERNKLQHKSSKKKTESLIELKQTSEKKSKKENNFVAELISIDIPFRKTEEIPDSRQVDNSNENEKINSVKENEEDVKNGDEKILIKDLLNKKIDKVEADSLEKGERSSGKSVEKVKYVPQTASRQKEIINVPTLESFNIKQLQEKFRSEFLILRQLKRCKNIAPFLEPVDEERDGAPQYYSIIDDPIDMKTIEFKLRNNIYPQISLFHADIRRMWRNARQYNFNNPVMLQVTATLERRYLKLLKQHRPHELESQEEKELQEMKKK